MKTHYADAALIIGLALIFSPWIFGMPIGWIWYCISLVGLVLAGIAGYDAQASMYGLGNPGEEILRKWVNQTKKFWKN